MSMVPLHVGSERSYIQPQKSGHVSSLPACKIDTLTVTWEGRVFSTGGLEQCSVLVGWDMLIQELTGWAMFQVGLDSMFTLGGLKGCV